jgi:hypothetical protein
MRNDDDLLHASANGQAGPLDETAGPVGPGKQDTRRKIPSFRLLITSDTELRSETQRRRAIKLRRDQQIVDEVVRRRAEAPQRSGSDIARDMIDAGFGISERTAQRILRENIKRQ